MRTVKPSEAPAGKIAFRSSAKSVPRNAQPRCRPSAQTPNYVKLAGRATLKKFSKENFLPASGYGVALMPKPHSLFSVALSAFI